MRRFLVVVVTVFSLGGPVDAQRRPRPSSPSPDISTQLSALGILPNEIRSILLIYSGRNMAKSEADKLEADIRTTPEDIDKRLKLMNTLAEADTDERRALRRVLAVVAKHRMIRTGHPMNSVIPVRGADDAAPRAGESYDAITVVRLTVDAVLVS